MLILAGIGITVLKIGRRGSAMQAKVNDQVLPMVEKVRVLVDETTPKVRTLVDESIPKLAQAVNQHYRELGGGSCRRPTKSTREISPNCLNCAQTGRPDRRHYHPHTGARRSMPRLPFETRLTCRLAIGGVVEGVDRGCGQLCRESARKHGALRGEFPPKTERFRARDVHLRL